MNHRLKAAVLAGSIADPASSMNAELKRLGAEEAWCRLRGGHPDIPSVITARAVRVDLDAVQRRAEAIGARFLVPGDAEWPPQLASLGAQEPWGLWVRGPGLSQTIARRAVAIVGARACTDYGRRVASEFAADIASHGNAVVSGGAYGIDAAAHRGAIAVDGVTIAVLASGVDVPYPAEHVGLFDRVLERGAIVSEALPGSGVTKPAFLVRNRLIAALAYGTVVVEARLRSGSISTFAHARAQQRVLMAVPGPINSPESGGTNALLKEGTCLVTSGSDVLSLVEPLGTVAPDVVDAPGSEWDALTAAEREVHEVLHARGGISIDAVLALTGGAGGAPAAVAALAMLAARGIVVERSDGTWRRVRALRGAVA